jgi:hypothetical protein
MSAAADSLQLDARFDAPALATAGRTTFLYPCIRATRDEVYLGAGSRLLCLAEFLKARIIPERIEHRI